LHPKAFGLSKLNTEYFDEERAGLGWRKGELQLPQPPDRDSHVLLLHSCAPSYPKGSTDHPKGWTLDLQRR